MSRSSWMGAAAVAAAVVVEVAAAGIPMFHSSAIKATSPRLIHIIPCAGRHERCTMQHITIAFHCYEQRFR